jgi:hypothetical protein
MYNAEHDMTVIKRDRKSVRVHYSGMSQWVDVRGGDVIKRSHDSAIVFDRHACHEAWKALSRVQGVEV